jgi:hypothetical protein
VQHIGRPPAPGGTHIMNLSRLVKRWGGPPLALQILALLIGGLVVAQLVTLVLSLLLPPPQPPQY